ncbi:acyl-CoA dehydrogenase family protein [Natronomonas sp. EA1]|uniref:acyl-CoA dehydrogenase family protein n=1 Tax=Natronomonas sp. EA1 TaxID=3421655 RepID=UPI003EBE3309
MEYHDSARASELEANARAFMDEVVIPKEREYQGQGPVPESVIADLREQAKEYGVYCPQIGEEYGGGGEAFRDVLPLFEQAGRSLLGAPAMRVDAPDEGNMHTFEMFGTEAQKEEWLAPLVAGEIHSGFSMTEPQPGGGSDPKMLKTTAEKDGDEWVINGHKWWTTQGTEADVLLVMAVTDPDAHPYEGASIIIVPSDADGVTIERDIPHLGQDLIHESHAEITYDNVRVPVENTLGPEHEGFSIAQARLGPARLTHCMRFSGMATRALDIAKAYMSEREAFGSKVGDKSVMRHRVADLEIKLHATKSMVRHAAREITEGKQARVPVSMSKVYAANACQEIIDFSIQACGGAGISKDLPISDFYEAVRAFRIIDGADEVHRRVIGRKAFEEVDTSEIEHLPQF